MGNNDYLKSTFDFDFKGEPYSFSIVHDLPETSGIGIDAAFYSWIYETDECSEASFCLYIKSKGFFAMPANTFYKLHPDAEHLNG